MIPIPPGLRADFKGYLAYQEWKKSPPSPPAPTTRWHFYQRYLANRPEFAGRDGLALALWHLCGGTQQFVVYAAPSEEEANEDRAIVDALLTDLSNPLARDYADVIAEKRLKIIPCGSLTGLHSSQHRGQHPDLVLIGGTPDLYHDGHISTWIERMVKDAVRAWPGCGLVLLGYDNRVRVFIGDEHIGYVENLKVDETYNLESSTETPSAPS